MRRIFLVMLVAIAGCNRPPSFSLQGYFFVSAPDEELARRENQRIVETVQGIVLAITEEKPDALLEHVAILTEVRFVRSGKEYDCEEAVDHLRRDLQWKIHDLPDHLRPYAKG